ncbi:hypothetical protein GCK32_020241 [Trichostrongylus colubriformis]|uniref:Secreted protein n=1 Tax=Trichostrongylus colubriformis TaxID=6319 RepID=A0AAN8ILP1_TRICO
MFIIYAAALLCTTSISTICCWTTGEGRPSPLQIDCSTASPKFQQAEGGTNEKGSKTVKQLSKKIKKVDPISKILSKGHKLIKPSDAQLKA